MITINKTLERPDKGTVPSGSVIDYKVIRNDENKTLRYNITHWLSEEAKGEGWKPIASVKDFPYKLIKECTEDEYLKLNEAGSFELEKQWLEDIINSII
jgi:hypothetical protein